MVFQPFLHVYTHVCLVQPNSATSSRSNRRGHPGHLDFGTLNKYNYKTKRFNNTLDCNCKWVTMDYTFVSAKNDIITEIWKLGAHYTYP